MVLQAESLRGSCTFLAGLLAYRVAIAATRGTKGGKSFFSYLVPRFYPSSALNGEYGFNHCKWHVT